VGIIVRHPKIAARLSQIFADDWALAEQAAVQTQDEVPAAKVAKRVAKIVTRELPDVATVLNGAVKEIVGNAIDVELNPDEVEAVVKGAVKEAVKEVVSDMLQEAVGEEGRSGQ
jgi:hypothetical protein